MSSKSRATRLFCQNERLQTSIAVPIISRPLTFDSLCEGPAARQTKDARAQIPTDGEVLQRLEAQSPNQGRGEDRGDWESGTYLSGVFVCLLTVHTTQGDNLLFVLVHSDTLK